MAAIAVCPGSEALAARLRFDADVRIVASPGEVVEAKAGEAVEWASERAGLAESPGRVPVLIVPVPSTGLAEIDVRLHPVRDWPSQATQAELDRATAELVASIVRVQKTLGRGDAEGTLTELSRIQARYPRVRYLDFYRASALFLKGDRKGALEALASALEAHPDDAEGQALRKTIGGAR